MPAPAAAITAIEADMINKRLVIFDRLFVFPGIDVGSADGS